jgi:hypothetical protein
MRQHTSAYVSIRSGRREESGLAAGVAVNDVNDLNDLNDVNDGCATCMQVWPSVGTGWRHANEAVASATCMQMGP